MQDAIATGSTAEAVDDSLVLGLRALATLVTTGPRDATWLAALHDVRATRVAAVIGELERGGLVRRLVDPTLVAATARGAALVGRARSSLH